MGTQARMSTGRLPRPLGAPNVPASANLTEHWGPDSAEPPKYRTHRESTGAGVRAPLSCDGGVRQGRRADIEGQRLVVVAATGWSEATTMEVREGSGRAV